MIFWASMEVYAPVEKKVEAIQNIIAPYITRKMASGVLEKFDVKIRYVPIVMPEIYHHKYKQRSRVIKKHSVLNISPILSYDVFLRDNLELRASEYCRGIIRSSFMLSKLDLSVDAIDEFQSMISSAPQNTLRAF